MKGAGYKDTLDRIEQHARSGSGGLVLAAPPVVGCSSLLQNLYDASFRKGSLPKPIYLSVEVSDESVVNSARRFALSFLTQVIAFRRREIELTTTAIGPDEIARLSSIEDNTWIDRALERLSERTSGNDSEVVGLYLSIIKLAESAGLKAFLIFDNLHHTLLFENGKSLMEGVLNLCRQSSFPSVIAGRRRFVSSNDEFDRVDLNAPTRAEAVDFIALHAIKNEIAIDEASRDLLAVQFGSRPEFIRAIFKRLTSSDDRLGGFAAIQRAYVEELFTGSIGSWFRREISSAVPNRKQGKLIELLENLNRDRSLPQSLEAFQRLTHLDNSEFDRAVMILNAAEIVSVASNRIESSSDDLALADYLRSRHRLENLGEPRSVVVSQTIAQCIGRSSEIMASTYRASTALDLPDLLRRFDASTVPLALLDPKIFNERYKGKTDEEIEGELKTDSDIFDLPFLVFAASTASAYRPIGSLVSKERSAFGSGFRDRNCKIEDEIYWLATEIDTKLPATGEQAEFWCDRLEAAAIASNFSSYHIWLIAPDGFDDEASKVLVDRNANGSSRKQAGILARILAKNDISDQTLESEYEIVIPMGEESELIAAHTLEEIGKKHGIKSHEINQIKTALVEACINASEHSHSPDGRIHQKFAVGEDHITITISNRGVRLADAKRPGDDSLRRGWGLKLIEKLMDDVHISQTDDGTRLSMTKRFANA